ncbi:uncharacterized protein Bfra_007808 [Botrytis fragariae]|uniref:Uncharacterized protein n=1 Tax=Botrytis fragariae TaxID=1964551 RepID=A0A8H6EGD0_9HELO|nr:uncharacterized protein Bfra_007808 [Botrytis fragariae]KAF5871292.1 hypothetical protein Bfra_007808 [Botrytis fragariae]
MRLQKFLVVLSSLTVVGISAPVVSQEGNFEIIERNEPNALILARHGTETDVHYISTIAENDAAAATDKTIERALGRKSIDEPNEKKRGDETIERALSRKNIDTSNEIIPPTLVSNQKKRGDETIVWVPPPPTSKIPERRGDETVVWVQPPPTPKIPM